MDGQRWALVGVVALAAALASPARPLAGEKPGPTPDLSGRWVYNVKASDDAREKMRDAMQGHGGRGGPGGGGPGMGGPGGGGMGGPGGGGMGGSGGRGAAPPGTGGDDDPREAMRAILEPAEELTITTGPNEVLVQEKFGATRALHPNGKTYKTDNGASEIKTQWKHGRLVVEKKNPRGSKLVETWELVPDGSRILLNITMEGGFGPTLQLKRVYDRAPASAEPAHAR
jgi:hypothetical protein